MLCLFRGLMGERMEIYLRFILDTFGLLIIVKSHKSDIGLLVVLLPFLIWMNNSSHLLYTILISNKIVNILYKTHTTNILFFPISNDRNNETQCFSYILCYICNVAFFARKQPKCNRKDSSLIILPPSKRYLPLKFLSIEGSNIWQLLFLLSSCNII